jgi:hypothetical protein
MTKADEESQSQKHTLQYWASLLFGKRYESLTDEEAEIVWLQIEAEVTKDDEKS